MLWVWVQLAVILNNILLKIHIHAVKQGDLSNRLKLIAHRTICILVISLPIILRSSFMLPHQSPWSSGLSHQTTSGWWYHTPTGSPVEDKQTCIVSRYPVHAVKREVTSTYRTWTALHKTISIHSKPTSDFFFFLYSDFWTKLYKYIGISKQVMKTVCHVSPFLPSAKHLVQRQSSEWEQTVKLEH